MRARPLLALIAALAGCAWFAIGARQAHDLARAGALIAPAGTLAAPPHLTPAQAARARDELSAAAFLYPGQEVEILRADLVRNQGDLPAALARLRRVVAAEPENLAAWVAFASAARNDPQAFARAVAQVRKLVPPVRR